MAGGGGAARFQDADGIGATLARSGFNAQPLKGELAALKTEDAATPALLRVPG